MIEVKMLVAAVPILADVEESLVRDLLPTGDELETAPAELAAGLAEIIWPSIVDGGLLGDVIPELKNLGSYSIHPNDTPSLIRHQLRQHTDMTWASLAMLDVPRIMSWSRTGANKAQRIVAWCIEQVLGRVAAAKDHRARFDPVAAADLLLAEFDERETAILDRVLHIGAKQPPTLKEIGETFGVSRERIRQVESTVRGRLDALVHRPHYSAVLAYARQLRAEVGSACPMGALPIHLQTNNESHLAELFATLSGPYQVENDWLVVKDLAPLDMAVEKILLELDPEGVVGADAVEDALSLAGIRSEHHDLLLERLPQVHLFDGRVLRWTGTLADKAVSILRVVDRPMEAEEISAALPDEHAIRSLKNYLGEDTRFTRRTKTTWGLSTWGGGEYTGIAELMVAKLSHSPDGMSLRDLQDDLDQQFGISRASSGLLSGSSPLFITAAGNVRLRREDEEYVPMGSLELTRNCFMVEGVWALRMEVDYDTVRGSGRHMPVVFATHLGLQPRTASYLDSPTGRIHVGWGYQAPWIGSTRIGVEEVGGIEGDTMFIRRVTPSSLEIRIVQQVEFERASDRKRLLLAVGADPDSSDSLRAVGESLGLGGAVTPTPAMLRARFLERGEQQLADDVARLDD